jgi:hypothetical protein
VGIAMAGLITKSLYVLFKRCPRLFALTVKKPELRDSADDGFAKHLAEQGIRVGRIAQEAFKAKGAIEVASFPIKKAVVDTARAVLSGCAIIEASFLRGRAFVRADILNLPESELIEIKSCTRIKDEHLDDVAIQLHVIRKHGLKVEKASLGLIDKTFVLKSPKTPLSDLITRVDITSMVEAVLPEIGPNLKDIEKLIKGKGTPARVIGQHCFSPTPCPFSGYCLKNCAAHTILNLRRDGKKKFELHASGIRNLSDIPAYVTLTPFQKLQKTAEKQRSAVIDRAKIKTYLGSLKYPLYFLDFEAFMEAVPRYKGAHPYEQIPFQASVHIQSSPDAKLEHHSFLHDKDTDPRKALAAFLARTIGNSGSVIVYHASYERGRIEDLMKISPRHHFDLKSINDRLWDLEEPFSRGWYLDPRFEGSTSIKYVLPVLVPDLSYKKLAIQNGTNAYISYLEMIAKDTPPAKRKSIYQSLLEYCGLDTLAMVRILSVLKEEVK